MDVRRLLSAMALEVQDLTPTETFERIAHYARTAVDASDSGILMVRARKKVSGAASTSGAVDRAHELQVECGEGPCLDTIFGEHDSLVTGDARLDPRWPTWGPRAAGSEFRSVVSVRLATRDRTYGSLNAFSHEPHDFTSSDLEVMKYLAAHATVAIAASLTVDGLTTALESRNLIGQAQGILMAVYDLDAGGAFQYLRRLSMHGNQRLFDVATQVVEQRRELQRTTV
ncbi:GAF and ANTAR domain-containing protein [Aeromicrobium sp. Leaf350]|uniref:GAF and ANTAR domain-containing protein n=1 Tax=Aeromicrobium sp. Leaf350 TaxID=2876565 RepID=UPI001E435BEC|nr:ANTAR domain-containing protein [Aeromicrobium sp. Leaf350]